VVVDAKVPLEAYLDALEATDEDERRRRLEVHASQVRAHVLKLASKSYWAELEGSPEFVVLFLPNEAMYGVALEQMPGLIEEGASKRVLVATPTTLIALLQTVHHGWRQERLALNAQKISEAGRIVHERIAILLEHWSKLGQSLGRATEQFNATVASFDSRVLPAVRRLEELGADSNKPLADLHQIEALPRALAVVSELPLGVGERAGARGT
jgi:DNA recombination protein RmuC